jgi:hypothetical protein
MMKSKMSPQAAVSKHEARMHPGKTKTFKAGGVTSSEMKKYGRNVARAMNQRSPVRKSSGPR